MTSHASSRPEDADLRTQAEPGHGIPSQDPDMDAQVQISAGEARREAHSSLVGGGAVAGMALGGWVGALVGGPVGAVIGTSVGGFAGAAAGSVVGRGMALTT